ncbi:GNAT family N-acetyltransferase [Evansella sp. LMS18]|jgi:GNAT superfamily N-acetyltransferase|uniref:GNAT family N-acetyltransferase n=1 Tax=Evansella sp. LMS18 TaxID=2924033 RepID=UPI0020D06256|nr:GNAT family N-acetyltransferase [Evansella sp. LMS18]UTR09881.1 GNAT family N-acetyltransferase [Evansella sp. LMS18]
MIIRDAKKQELELIRKQRVDAYRDHADSVPSAHWEALKAAISSEADSQPEVEVIVAEIEGTIVGSVVLFPAESDAYDGHVDKLGYPEIRMLAVDQKARGKGAAYGLVAECISRAKKKGYKYIGLHTGEFMKGAMRLYERMGFERVPENDFVPADDGIVVKAFRRAV